MAKGTLLSSTSSLKSVKRSGSSSSITAGGAGKKQVSGGTTTAAASTTAAAAVTANKKHKAAAVKALKDIAGSSSRRDLDDGDGEGNSGSDGGAVTEVDKHGNNIQSLRVNDQKYARYLRSTLKENLGGLELYHAEGEDTVEKVLKTFDLNADYGPAVGMTRLERWKRAAQWGLDPPQVVLDILVTKEGGDKKKYRESLYSERF